MIDYAFRPLSETKQKITRSADGNTKLFRYDVRELLRIVLKKVKGTDPFRNSGLIE